ncbi:hypothetical protein SAMN02910456_01814 [Ruminococcaceae bacterium YRB3002]|nr:hypothetical protein SAMN02910456_01814 [Ruminococcaceae bacterium YRB3002]
MEISRRHLEFKIAYIRHQLSLIPHGFFKSIGCKDYVYLFFDPADTKVTRANKRRIALTSKRGKQLSEQVKKYVELKGQLDLLLKEWKTKYRDEPRDIQYPLRKKRRDRFDYAFFRDAIPNQETHKNLTPIDHNGHIFFSKNEVVGAQIVEKLEYEYKAGVRIVFDQFTEFCPDIIFYVPEIDKVILMEIDGAMDKVSYITKSYHNTAACVINELVEMKDFIVVRIGSKYEVSAVQIENMIHMAIEAAIDDIIV